MCRTVGGDDKAANCAIINSGAYPAVSCRRCATGARSSIVSVSRLSLVCLLSPAGYAPGMHGFGMQWLPVLSLWAACNIPVALGLLAFQQVEVTYHSGVFVLATIPSIFFAWLITKQAREMFVWRKVALSQAKLEHERLFNAFLCHEVTREAAQRVPFAASLMPFVRACLLSDQEPLRRDQRLRGVHDLGATRHA
jgi:hypothetical protein